LEYNDILHIGKGWTCSLCKLDTFGLAYENWTGLVYGVVNAWFWYVWTDLVYECMVLVCLDRFSKCMVLVYLDRFGKCMVLICLDKFGLWCGKCMVLVNGFGQILK
jgi:hypothetical protein